MRWAKITLSVVLLLGPASVAAAECAWVLWVEQSWPDAISRSVVGAEAERDIFGAYDAHAACEQSRDARVKEYAEALRDQGWNVTVDVEKAFVIGTSVLKAPRDSEPFTTRSLTRYMCLPDTIDPREKKE